MDFCNKSEDATSWEKFHVSISKEELYHEDDPMIDELLQDMTSLEFYNISKSFVRNKPVCFSRIISRIIWLLGFFPLENRSKRRWHAAETSHRIYPRGYGDVETHEVNVFLLFFLSFKISILI